MRLQFILLLVFQNTLFSQSNPAITSWKINSTGVTGYGGFATNVQQVQYSNNNVYISTNDIASWIPNNYDWPNNPWFPEAQQYVFKITLNPQEKPVNKVITPYGHIGLWSNGVSIYNPKDAKSWKDSSIWFQNALYFEHIHLQTFDDCFGHPNNTKEYHTHVNPVCLYDNTDSLVHAPLIGYAFDGFPIYGAYAFSNSNGTGAIRRMLSSYQLRNITERTTLPDGTVLPPALYGPPLTFYTLGAYVEDYEYVNGLGDLDQYNGRYCITPEYPNGTYAYFVTINESLFPQYPYVIGPRYFGTVQMGNTGPNSGHNTINEPVIVFTSVGEATQKIDFKVFPNPAIDHLHFYLAPSPQHDLIAILYNAIGGEVGRVAHVQTAVEYELNLSGLPTGLYFLNIVKGANFYATSKIVVGQY